MKTLRIIGFALVAILICLSACSGGDDPIEPTPKPEIVKSEITIDSSIITNGLSFTTDKGEQSISFSTNKSWTLSVASTTSGTTWCTASATSGDKGTASVKFDVSENTSYDNRSVSVTIKSGTATKTFTISQKGVDAMLVTTDKYEIGQEGGTIDIEVKANISYQMEISENAKSWITEASGRGLTTYKHSLNIAMNEENEKREGEVYFKSGDKVETVKVYQAGGAILLLSENECNVSDKGETISVDIRSNIDFGVEMPDVDWIVDEASSRGLSSHTLKYVVKANEEYDARTASIVFFDKNSELKDTLVVNQAQKDAIVLFQKQFIVEQEGGTVEVKLMTNVDLDINMPKLNWISMADSRGLKEHSLCFEIEKNENTVERSAEIILCDKNSSLSDTVKIVQKQFVKGFYLPSGESFYKLLYAKSIYKNKIKFVAKSNKTSSSLFFTDKNGKISYLIDNGEWHEIHTSADEFIAHEDCSYMFRVTNFTSIDFGENFNTSNVTDMSYMFTNCQLLETLNIDAFDTSNVTNMRSMFVWCHQLKKINVSHFDVSNVINMGFMFQHCGSLKELDVKNFNTCNVEDMSYLFSVCFNLENLDLSTWDTSKVKSMEHMFWECSALKKIDISSFNTENVSNMGGMFCNCTSLSELDLSNFNTENVTDMGSMFYGCSSLSNLDLNNFNTSNVTNMAVMFEECSSITEFDLSNFNTENVTNMGGMFYGCSSLSNLDLTNFDTSNVTNMHAMFENCKNMKTLNIDGFSAENIKEHFYLNCFLSGLSNLALLNLGNSFVPKYGDLLANWKEFGNKTGLKIICCQETMEYLKKGSLRFVKIPITWINAETKEIM